VLALTGADALMIGRAAQGRPWIFREIAHYLATGESLDPPTVAEARALIVAHLADHHAFYGEATGVRIARKHLGWYTRGLPGAERFRAAMNAVESAAEQVAAVERYCDVLAAQGPWFAARDDATPAAGSAGDMAPARAGAEALAA
jgi:tRNA-dihydrouridine synthase B